MRGHRDESGDEAGLGAREVARGLEVPPAPDARHGGRRQRVVHSPATLAISTAQTLTVAVAMDVIGFAINRGSP